MKLYYSKYLHLIRYAGNDYYGTCAYENSLFVEKHLDLGNKLFRISGNPIFLHYVYGETITKITNMKFLSYTRCV